MNATQTKAAPRRVGRTFTDTAIIARRNLLLTVRLPQVLAFSTIQPVTSLLLYTYILGGALALALPPAAAGNYVNWLIPGLLVQYAIFSGGQTAAGLADDLSKGTIDRFRSLPMARSAVLAGRTASDLLRTALVLVLLVSVGLAVGFRPQLGLAGVLGGLAVALAFSYAWSWVMAAVGLLVRTTEAVQVIGYLLFFPLTFASSAFVPTTTMPVWLQGFIEHQPVSAVANAVRGLMLGAGALPAGQSLVGEVALALLWSVAIHTVFAPIAVSLYRRAQR